MFEGPESYAPILPEIILACGAMVLLMVGAFRVGTNKTIGRDVGWFAIVLFALAIVLLALQSTSSAYLFADMVVVDSYARFMKILVLAGAGVSVLLAFDYFFRHGGMPFEIPVLMMLSVVGMMVMISAKDLLTLYVGLELQSLALYVLAAIRRSDLRSSEAGLKYFVLGALSSGMLLYGMSLLYGFSGSTGFVQIADAMRGEAANNIGLIVGLVFLLVGLAFKISAVPFHMWTPDVYEGAPTPVTAFFSAAPKVAAMAVLVRVLVQAFPGSVGQWQQIIVFLSIMSMAIGAFAAIGQTNIKRLMAYSSIGHIGFALVGLAAGSAVGIEAVVIYLAIYMVMTLGAFACILAMQRKDGMVEDINQLAGLSQSNLSMAFIFAMLLFSMAGIPPLAGFFAKFYVFNAAIKAGLYPLAVIGVLASVVAAFYYLRVIRVMFFDEAKDPFQPAPPCVRFVMWTAGIFVLAYVVLPSPLINAAAAAVRTLRFAP